MIGQTLLHYRITDRLAPGDAVGRPGLSGPGGAHASVALTLKGKTQKMGPPFIGLRDSSSRSRRELLGTTEG